MTDTEELTDHKSGLFVGEVRLNYFIAGLSSTYQSLASCVRGCTRRSFQMASSVAARLGIDYTGYLHSRTPSSSFTHAELY
jgi:hypothetical protein